MKNNLYYLIFLASCLISFSCIRQSDTTKKNVIQSPKVPLAHFRSSGISIDHPRITKLYRLELREEHWPFFMYKDETHMVVGNINGDPTLDLYAELIERYGGDGTGYDWTALLQHMLQREDAALLQHLDFDPEACAFYVFADSEKNQRAFVQFAARAFKDTTHLIRYLELPGGLDMLE